MKKTVILALMALMPLGLAAQNGGQGARRFDPQKFQQHIQAELTREAALTADEARAFFPLYNEMRARQRAIGDQIRRLKHDTPAQAKDCAATVARIKQLQVESAQTEQQYYKRLLKAVPPEKVFRAMKAEDDFHRKMVQGERRSHKDTPPQPRSRRGQGAPADR